MNCIEVITQFLLTKILRWTRIVRTLNALPTAVIHLLVDVVLDMLGVMGRIFHLHETALLRAVRTLTGRCKDSFGGDRAINDVWTFSLSCAMSVPF
jgi:arginine exporter protein ArgO